MVWSLLINTHLKKQPVTKLRLKQVQVLQTKAIHLTRKLLVDVEVLVEFLTCFTHPYVT